MGGATGSTIVTYTHDKDGDAKRNPTDQRRRYTQTDHLGSIVAITDEIGAVEERFSFDAWGKRRAVEQATLADVLKTDPYNFSTTAIDLKSNFTDKGFTGHRQLDGVGIIHMGGRIYDAEIGRFLQVDPFVQDRTNSQALNRYSYVLNNPLSYVDPSGFFFKKLVKKLKKVFSRINRIIKKVRGFFFRAIGRIAGKIDPTLRSILIATACAGNAVCYIAWSAQINAAIAYANTGSFNQAFRAGAIAGVRAAFEVATGNMPQPLEFNQGPDVIMNFETAAKAAGEEAAAKEAERTLADKMGEQVAKGAIAHLRGG